MQYLKGIIDTVPQIDYPAHSRIHDLKSYAQCYVKRDDELGFGISGSKIRKYRTLIPYLINNDYDEVVVIGSAYSNHVLGFVQLLIENQIEPTLFLRGDPKRELIGNALLTSLFVREDSIHWFSKDEWHTVHAKANDFAANQKNKTFVLPEGGSCSEALPGALTLPLDIIKNENESNLQFEHVFIDSGTGLMAIALILGFAWLDRKTKIHAVLIADNEASFVTNLKEHHANFCKLMNKSIPFPENFNVYLPESVPGFGKINAGIFEEIRNIATTEGFLTDPVYSAKLFIEAQRIIDHDKIKGKTLIMHSGGALTLAGFQDRLVI